MIAQHSDEYQPETIDDLKDRGKKNGFKVIEATAYDLLLDLDSGAAYDQFKKNRLRVEKLFPFKSVDEWKSKGGNTHVLIKLMDHLPDEP